MTRNQPTVSNIKCCNVKKLNPATKGQNIRLSALTMNEVEYSSMIVHPWWLELTFQATCSIRIEIEIKISVFCHTIFYPISQ